MKGTIISTENNAKIFRNCAPFISYLRYYATFKVRKFESLFYKTDTCFQKTTTCIGLQAEQIFSVNI